MAPRIRLSLSKPLPTICETHEEATEDSTSNPNSTESTAGSPDLDSSDDYIQSICHLARPTFPGLPESSRKVQDRKTPKILEDVSWSPSLGGTQQEISNCKLTNCLSTVVLPGKVTPAEADLWSREDPLAQIYTCAGKLCSSKASLYGKSSSISYSQCNFSTPNSELQPSAMKEKATGKPNFPRGFSFPRLPSPRPVQKDVVCSELKCLRRDEGAVLGGSHSQEENGPMFNKGEEQSPSAARGKLVGNPALPCAVQREGCLFNTAAGTEEKEERDTSHHHRNVMGDVPTKQSYSEGFQVPKKAGIHKWISEHRCIWKEAKVSPSYLRFCVLTYLTTLTCWLCSAWCCGTETRKNPQASQEKQVRHGKAPPYIVTTAPRNKSVGTEESGGTSSSEDGKYRRKAAIIKRLTNNF